MSNLGSLLDRYPISFVSSAFRLNHTLHDSFLTYDNFSDVFNVVQLSLFF